MPRLFSRIIETYYKNRLENSLEDLKKAKTAEEIASQRQDLTIFFLRYAQIIKKKELAG
ncbi:MAG: hypothetical protein ACPLXC_03205 [Candidatus Pacearchaeota archaeon]